MSMAIRSICAATVAVVSLTACRSGTEPASKPETPSLSVTNWTDKTELFMEYPPFVAGQSAYFAVHLTTMADFKAVTSGRATIEFIPEAGGQTHTIVSPKPSRAGVFRVEGPVPSAAGRYRWALVVDTGSVQDRHDLGVATVFADEKSAFAEAEKGPADDPTAISYLKEQQWTNEFATAPVQEADVRTSIRVPAWFTRFLAVKRWLPLRQPDAMSPSRCLRSAIRCR